MTMDMKSMVAALASMPEGQRKTMMTERLNLFYELPENDQRNAMGQMTEAVGTLSLGDAQKLIKTRTEILCDFPDSKRNTLMRSHMAVLQGGPQDRMMAEMENIQAIVPQLSQRHQQQVQEMMKMMPMAATAVTPRPAEALARTFARPTAAVEFARLAGWATTLLWIVVAAGAWLVIAPFILGYGATTRALANDIILGIGVAVLAGIVAITRPVE